MCLVVGPAAAQQKLVVEYRSPSLSVEAHGVPLAQVLAKIGAAVGFQVVGRKASTEPVDVVIKNASLEDVLTRLLRGENHTLVYRQGDGGAGAPPVLDQVVLLGAAQRGTPGEEAPAPNQAAIASAPSGVPLPIPAQAQAAKAASVPAPSAPDPLSRALEAMEREAADDQGDGRDVTVADMLKAHAMAALLAAQGGAAQAPAPPPAAGSSRPGDLEAQLAETTRRAQQSLSALVEGLAAATRSLQESAAAPRK